jgi:hypothetical protein
MIKADGNGDYGQLCLGFQNMVLFCCGEKRGGGSSEAQEVMLGWGWFGWVGVVEVACMPIQFYIYVCVRICVYVSINMRVHVRV